MILYTFAEKFFFIILVYKVYFYVEKKLKLCFKSSNTKI